MIALDKMNVGSPPAGFHLCVHRAWHGRRMERGRNPRPRRAVRSSKPARIAPTTAFRSRSSSRFSAANVDVELRFKAVGGKIDQAAGIVVRLHDADNYYVARANALEDNVRFYRVVNGRREQLKGADLQRHGERMAQPRPARGGRTLYRLL